MRMKKNGTQNKKNIFGWRQLYYDRDKTIFEINFFIVDSANISESVMAFTYHYSSLLRFKKELFSLQDIFVYYDLIV